MRDARNLKYDLANNTLTFQVFSSDGVNLKGVKILFKIEDGNLYGYQVFAKYRSTTTRVVPDDADLDVGSWTGMGGLSYRLDSITFELSEGHNLCVVSGYPFLFGSPVPGYGNTFWPHGDTISVSLPESDSFLSDAAGTTRGHFSSVVYQFASGSPVTNTTASFTLEATDNFSVEWNFVDIERRIVAEAPAGGTVMAAGSIGVALTNWIAAGETLTVTATPASGYRFAGWLGDVPDGADVHAASIVLPADGPRKVRALFLAVVDSLPGGYQRIKCTTIPITSAKPKDAVVLPNVQWKQVRSIYCRYATTNTTAGTGHMFFSGTASLTAAGSAAPWVALKGTKTSGSAVSLNTSSVTATLTTTPGDSYNRDGTVHEFTIDIANNSQSASSSLYFQFGGAWSDTSWNGTTDFHEIVLLAADATEIAHLWPCIETSTGNVGFYDTVAREFRTKLLSDWADFIAGGWDLVVSGHPAGFGSPTPGYGLSQAASGEQVSFSLPGSDSFFYDADATTRGRFASATCQFEGGAPLTNAVASFALLATNNLAVTWNFGSFEKRLVAEARTGGTVSAGGSSGVAVTNWAAASGSFTAVAAPGYRFAAWRGDTEGVVSALTSATIVLPADRPRNIYALFALEADYSALDYVRNGLFAQWDGIDNIGVGAHDETAKTWVDLSGNGCDAVRKDGEVIPWANGNSMVRPANNWNTVVMVNSMTMDLDTSFTFDFCGVQPTKAAANMFHFVPTGGKKEAYQLVNANWEAQARAANVNYNSKGNFYTGGSLVSYRDGPTNVHYNVTANTAQTNATSAVGTQGDATGPLYLASNSGGTSSFLGNFYALRLYNRPLRVKEIRWNATVDRIRFFGESVEEGEVEIYATPINVAAPSPSYGARMFGISTNNTFTIGGLVTDDHDGARIAGETAGTDIRYVYTGYAFTNGVSAPVVVSGAGESVTVERISLFNDLVWKFRKEYRTIATSALGGTVTVAGVNGACVTNFTDGGTLTIRATPDTAAGYSFFKWQGDVYDIADPTQEEVVVPVKSRNLVATYTWEEPGHVPVTTAWNPSLATGDWNDPANWDNGVPQKGDTVIISNVAANTTLTIPVPTAELALLAVGNTNGKTTTLVQDGWYASICAATVDLGKGVTVTCKDACTYGGDLHRVHLRGTNLFLRTGAKIDVEKKGYKAGTGPCWPNGSGSSTLGGAYGGVVDGINHSAYGSAEFPVDPGSGGWGGAGGGAVRIEFSGAVVIDGDVMANGGYMNVNNGAGSGGGVWITSRTIAGTGRVLANARNPWEDDFKQVRMAGGGGRVAVHYDTMAQNGVTCGIRFEARGGLYRIYWRNDTFTNVGQQEAANNEPTAGAGTIWFSDNRFLTAEPYATDGWKFAGVWRSPVPVDSLDIEGDLTLDASYVTFPAASFALSVGGNLKATGVGYRAQRENGLVLSNATVNVAGDLELYGARLKLTCGSLLVGGDATLDGYTYKDQAGTSRNLKSYEMGGGEIQITASPTVEPGMVGATVTVGGTLHLAANSVIKPYCDPETGSIVSFRVKNLTMDAGSYFDATLKGFGARLGPGRAETTNYAASHGGKGGAKEGYEDLVAEPYGNIRRPLLPGSGAWGSYWGGSAGFKGGGVVYVTASDSMTLNGEILADGNHRYTCRQGPTPGSSGGSVYLVTRKLRQSTGSIYARGGVASSSQSCPTCTGGGGRIAIWYGQNRFDTPADFAAFTNNVSAAAGVVVTHSTYTITEWTDETHSEDGTVYFGRLTGALILVK